MDVLDGTSFPVSNTTVSPTSVVLVGDWRECEFATSLQEIAQASEWPAVAHLADAGDFTHQSQHPPELFLVAQPMPGAFQQSEVNALQALAPLSRIVLVAGTWCEGELRTGTPLAGVIRLYWYELASWWQAAIRRRNAGLCPLWSMPLNSAHAGRTSNVENLLSKREFDGCILIESSDYSVYETLAAALKVYQIDSAWAGHSRLASSDLGVGAGIWDGSQLSASELQRLQCFCQRVHGPVLALLDFPRREHFDHVRKVGATRAFAKPYVVEELVAALFD